MPLIDENPSLELALPLTDNRSSRLGPALLLLGLIGGGIYAAADIRPKAKVPMQPADLSANIVTIVAPDDRFPPMQPRSPQTCAAEPRPPDLECNMTNKLALIRSEPT